MNTAAVCFLGACALASCLVSATPVYPKYDMKHYYPSDICLFICNICFDGMTTEMMDCANHVCLANQQSDFILGLLKVGRTCKKFKQLQSLKAEPTYEVANDTE